jgi:hypothetical protein
MIFSIPSDVYSFGVFLVELVSGRGVASDQSIIQWVNAHSVFFVFCDKYSPIYPLFIEAFVTKAAPCSTCIYFDVQAQNFQESSDISAITDNRMRTGFTSEGMKELLRLTSWCLNPMIEQRPSMSLVEAEIHRIREQEIRLTSVMAEGIPTVTLVSQLFVTSR